MKSFDRGTQASASVSHSKRSCQEPHATITYMYVPNVQTYLVTLSHIVFALSAFHVRARALLFSSASCGKTHPSRTAIRMQRRSLDALSFRARLDVLALRAALLTSLRLPEIEFTSRIIRTELRSRQSLLASLACDRLCSCFNGSLLVLCHITSEPFFWRLWAALLALHVLTRAMTPITFPEMLSGK